MPEELQRQSVAERFEHELVHREPHFFVKSTCKRCGASESDLSVYDGSLEKWEDEHDCKSRPRVETLARFRSWLRRARELNEDSQRVIAKHKNLEKEYERLKPRIDEIDQRESRRRLRLPDR